MENKLLPKLDLNITNRCNFRCTHCAFDSGIAEMGELTLGELEKILSETKELGGKRFDITGGEPLLREDVEKIILSGKELGYKIELITNSSLLTGEKLNRLKELGLDAIAISLDGSTPEAYNRIRKREREEFYNALEKISGTKRKGFYTKVNTTVFSHNLDDIPNITELALKLGADEQGLYYFTPVGRGGRSRELSAEPTKWLEFVRNKLKPYQKQGMKITLELPLIEKELWNEGMGCIAEGEKSHLQILPDGNVYPCVILASYHKPIANLHRSSVKEIWNNNGLWKKYWEEIQLLFDKMGGYCVDFQEAFNMRDYGKRYGFVCPLRKFDLEDIK